MLSPMLKFSRTTICTLAAVLTPLSSQALEPDTQVEGITEFQLDNGLQVLLFPDPASSTVTVNVTYQVGSRHEGRGEKGMAHLLEHMVFKGTPTTKNIWGALEDHGAKFNGTTWVDRTNYYETLPATEENLEFALAMEADRMVNSLIAAEDLEKEMTVVRNEFEMGENNPIGVLFDRMLSTAYLWHNYGFSTIGNRSDIERVPAANLKRFYQTYYQPDNAMLVVAGNFDPEATLARIEALFGPIPRPERTLEATWTEEPPQDGPRYISLERVGDVAAAGLVYHIPPGAHEDFAAIQVLQELLTSEPAGVAYKELVETGKLAAIQGYSFAWAEPGVMLLLGQVSPDSDPVTVEETMHTVVEESGSAAFSEEEVERIKTRLLKDIKLSLTNSGKIGVELSEWAALGDWRLFFLHRDRLKAVTAADVQRVAQAYLLESNRTAGVFIPTAEPLRATIPVAPDVVAMTKDYEGTEEIEQGEAFDATPENIDARTTREQLGEHVKLALLPKKTRGESVRLHARIHVGDEASLIDWVDATSFLPDMLMRGAGDMDYQALQDQIDTLQSTISFSGGPGLLEVDVVTDKTNLAATLELLTTILHAPRFDKSEFEIVQKENISALEEGLSDPQTLAMRALSRATRPFPTSSIHYEPTQQELLDRMKALTAEQIKSCYDKFYGGDYAEIAAIGDFDPDELRASLKKMLGGWETPIPYTRIAMPFIENKSGLDNIDTPDKKMAIVTRSTNFSLTEGDPEFPAFDFALYTLGQSAKSRLLNKLRHEGGLSYGAGAFSRVSALDPGATLAGYAICAPENARKALDVMVAEMDGWIADGLTDTELEEGKVSYILQMQNDFANDAKVVGNLALGLELDRTFAYYADLMAKIESLDKASVQEVLTSLFAGKNFYETMAGDIP